MAIGNPYDRDYFVIGGAVKTTGGSLNLPKGTLALVDQSVSTLKGSKVLATVSGKSKKDKDLVLRLGTEDRSATRSHSNGSQKTLPFALNEVVDLKVSVPETTEQTVDEIILGYDGINPESAFKFRNGDSTFRITLELSGDAIAYRGGGGKDVELVSVSVDMPECNLLDTCEDCDPCANLNPREIILEAIEQLKRRQITGGNTVDQYVDITPVFSCADARTASEIPYDYYCLSVCDSGTPEALALVSKGFDSPVIMTERIGSTSTYQVLLPRSVGAPSAYTQTLASLIKGCDECPSGYSATNGGVLYSISIEDDGVDQKSIIQALPGAVGGTAIRNAGVSHGIGFYTVILNDELTPVEINTFLTGGAVARTAVFESFGDVQAICENGTVTTINWANCGSCNVIEEVYTITLPDNKCGDDRLAELNKNYSQTVTIATRTSKTATVTLTGTTGTANITVDGTAYLATYSTSLTTTAANFVAAHAANILADKGIIVTSTGAGVVFKAFDDNWALPSIANATLTLSGTVGAVTPTTLPARAACQTIYSISVVSNIVCDECDTVFEDFYTTEAPEPFGMYKWEKAKNVGSNPSGVCLTGIRIKAKTFALQSDESLRDLIGFVETSTKLRASAGYPLEVREGIGRINHGIYQAKYLSRWVPRTHLAGNLRDLENESRYYFRGYDYKDYLGRVLSGEISNLENQLAQYVMYTLQIRSDKHAQGFGGRVSQDINYQIWVEVGRHKAVESLLNNIATNAGISAVSAFGY